MTSVLEGELGFISDGAKPTAGWELTPTAAAGGSLAKITCGATVVSIRGSVVAPVSSLDKMSSTFELKLKASKGKQAPEALEGSAKATLGWAVGAKPEEQLGLTSSATASGEEALEIKAIS